MSIASDYVNIVKLISCDWENQCFGWVNDKGQLELNGAETLTAEQALFLAKWIESTFTDYPRIAK
jgi:hypothetical protein